jgi:DNA-directed RNA polymerase specialized sigma24 family protein
MLALRDVIRLIANLTNRAMGALYKVIESVRRTYRRRSQNDLVQLKQAIDRMAAVDQRMACVFELRVFGNFEFDQIAELFSISTRTVKRDWHVARCWLWKELRHRT